MSSKGEMKKGSQARNKLLQLLGCSIIFFVFSCEKKTTKTQRSPSSLPTLTTSSTFTQTSSLTLSTTSKELTVVNPKLLVDFIPTKLITLTTTSTYVMISQSTQSKDSQISTDNSTGTSPQANTVTSGNTSQTAQDLNAWTSWAKSPEGQTWLNSESGQQWLGQQQWLKYYVIEDLPEELRSSWGWWKDQYLNYEKKLVVVSPSPTPAVPTPGPASAPTPTPSGAAVGTIWPKLPCVGYFDDAYRQEMLKRLTYLSISPYNQGDIVLFVGDSLTQNWTDMLVGGPACGPGSSMMDSSGLYYWNNMIAGVKVNLGLRGIRSCASLYEYDRFYREKIKAIGQRVKAVVINLGTNDIGILSTVANSKPEAEVEYIRQLIDLFIMDLNPQTQFIVTSIGPCYNSSYCQGLYNGKSRVELFNWNLSLLNGYANRTKFQYIDIKDAELTIDKIHYTPCAYKKSAMLLAPLINPWISNTTPQSIPQCQASAVHNFCPY